MACYESVFIISQNTSSSGVDTAIADFTKIVKEHGGTVIKTEYWGLRTLAYEIINNKKGHYVFLGLDADVTCIKEMERKMKLSENVIRFSTIKVESISKDPSPVLKGKNVGQEDTIDVTVNI
jgi:small subunit ribosomal protein S6